MLRRKKKPVMDPVPSQMKLIYAPAATYRIQYHPETMSTFLK
jgi:hypothetical protein